jgi:hypothetical protein
MPRVVLSAGRGEVSTKSIIQYQCPYPIVSFEKLIGYLTPLAMLLKVPPNTFLENQHTIHVQRRLLIMPS